MEKGTSFACLTVAAVVTFVTGAGVAVAAMAWPASVAHAVSPPPPSVPPPVPSQYQSTYSAIGSNIANIPSQDTAGTALVNSNPTIMATELSPADGDYGTSLLKTGYINTVNNELSNLQQMGAKAVVVNVAFPLLLPSFQDSSQYLSFYEQVAASIHADGMSMEIEQNPLIPALTSVPVSSFYSTLTTQTYAADQQQQAQIAINDLHPEYIDLIDEVDTFEGDTGLSFGTTSGLTILLTQELTGLVKNTTKIGAGIGAWESTSLESAIAAVPGIDYLSVHFYPLGSSYQSQMSTMNQVTTIAANAKLPLFFDETWDDKEPVPAPPPTGAPNEQKLQTFDFWEPLDSQFLAAITGYARAHHFSLLSPFGSNNFFSYLTWTPTLDAESTSQVVTTEIKQVAKVLPTGSITPVGQTYMALDQSPAPTALSVVTTALPAGIVGCTYSATLVASGGIPPYSWSSPGGGLPAGVSLAPDGVVNGTPTSAGTASFTAQVSDSSVPPSAASGAVTINVTSGSCPTTTTTSTPTTTSSTTTIPPPKSTTTTVPAGAPGYWMLGSGGTVYPFGSARNFGSATVVAGKTVGMAATADGNGYWVVSSTGVVKNFGDAQSLLLSEQPASPVVAIAVTPDGGGYWIATSAGQVSVAGDARYFNAITSPLNAPIVAMATTPDGGGYWLLGSDGGVFTFGDAGFFGSTGSIHLNAPAVAMAPTADGMGYWFVASDGGIFTYGDARFFGSMGGKSLVKPVDGIVVTTDGAGYWLVASDGGVFTFGDAGFVGSLGGRALSAPIVAFAPV